jgi:hypothetical protein
MPTLPIPTWLRTTPVLKPLSTLPVHASGLSRLRKSLLVCGISSSIWYVATDAIASWRDPDYSYTDQTFSELLAAGAPSRSFMVAANGIPYGVMVNALAAGVWMSAEGKTRQQLAAASLAGYGVSGTLTGVALNMDRRSVIAAGNDSLRNRFHGPGTMVMSGFVLATIFVAANLFGRKFRNYSYATAAVLVVFGIWTSSQIRQMEAGEVTPWMGLKERVNIYATMLWIVVLSIELLLADRQLRAS